MKNLIFTILLCSSSFIISAQNNNPKFTVPEEYTFVYPEDYAEYEPQIKEAIDWYLWRSMAFDSSKRQKTSTFFFKWLTGSPSVSVEINTDIVNFFENNPELLLVFTMGWTKYSIDNDYSKDIIKSNKAGIETVVNYYNKNKGFLKKNKDVEDYEKMIKKNKLEEYIAKKLNQKKK